MNVNIRYFFSVLILVLSFFKPYCVGAQYYSQNDLKKIVTVDKKIRLVKNNDLLDNISDSKYVFVDGDTIEFEIVITNAGNEDLLDIKLRDELPKYLSLVFNPGSFDKNLNTINWNLDKLLPGQSRTYLVRAKISGVGSANRIQILKLTNKIYAVTGNIEDKDFATYFVGKKTVPATGDDSLPVKTALLVSVSVSALLLRKLARGY